MSRGRAWIRCTMVAIAILASGPASASIVEVRREIEVFASYTYEPYWGFVTDFSPHQAESEDFGVWNPTLEERMAGSERVADGYGRIALESEVTPTRIAFSTRVTGIGEDSSVGVADPDLVDWNYFTIERTGGNGRSWLRAVLQIDQPTPYMIDVTSVNRPPPGPGDVRIGLLRNPNFPINDFESIFGLRAPAGYQSIRREGVLQPGRYDFTIRQPWTRGNPQGLDVLFVIPEPSIALLLGLGLVAMGAARPRSD